MPLPPAALRLGPMALLGLVAAGCTVGPAYRKPEIALPAAYHGAAGAAAQTASAAVSPARWWTGFNDPLLTRVVERALRQNLDLEGARARIAQSRATARAAGAALLPKGELQASASDQELSLLSPFGAVGSEVPGFERDYDLYDLGAAASWEVDLFGGLRRARQAARADAAAARDDAAAVQVSVAAEAADAYLQVRAYQARLAVARRQERVEERLVALLVQRRGEGVASDRELRQARAALDGVRATLPPLKAGEEGELDRLDVLMGAPAGTYAAEIAAEAPLPVPPSLAGLGAPVDLLRRRPDVAAAERRLAGNDARIGAAIADYYPKLSITGLLGVESLDASRLLVGDALQHTVTGGLRWRLFDFGRVDAEVARARGREAESLAAYRQAVYRATGEVETALSDLVQSEAEAAALDHQIAELTRARDQAEAAYRGGVISLIEVLDADRDLLAASDQLARARSGAARAAVASFRATGGGWTG
jgi:NodT family efflux transporter outer membrane factor (OMF) lipoprotein